MSDQYDIAVIGSGFAGSLLAMIARRLGLHVVLLERGKHPRFAIGESSTPLSNLLLEDLATRYNLPKVASLSKWGSWQKAYPELPCGLKRGFTFLHHALGQPSGAHIDRGSQLLIAASPHDGIADTHWYREDLDHFLVCEAQEVGADYIDEVDLQRVIEDERDIRLQGTRNGRNLEIIARFVVDATGPRGFLHGALSLGERPLPGFPATEALYSHFSGVRRIQDLSRSKFESQPPYPIDDAAVHHIFDGGWAWVLRFNNGVTSAGVAATDELAKRFDFSDGARAWERLLQQVPVLRDQFAMAETVQSFRHIARLGFRSAAIRGRNWALLPSAAGFVDPLLSTGFPLTLLGVSRLAKILEVNWGTDNFNPQLESYSSQTDAELLATSRLIGALYANMRNFPVFAALSLLYFAAASYSETARRLGKPHLATSFLLHDHPQFGPNSAHIMERARSVKRGSESNELIEEVFQTIEPIDVAGLGKRERKNWYPVEAEDLLSAAPKVGATHDEITQMMGRCGFWPATSLV